MTQHSSSAAWPARAGCDDGREHRGDDIDAELQDLDRFEQLAIRAVAVLHRHRRGEDGLCPIDGSAFPCARACCAADNIELARAR